MKKQNIILAAALCCGLLTIASLSTGCVSTSVVKGGATNSVTSIDPVRLQQAVDAIEPAASSVLRRAIKRSPEHAAEISTYARTIGKIFCQMAETKQFNPVYLITAADAATMQLQDGASDDIIDAKNAAVALYKILWADKLTVDLPDSQWPEAVCRLFCQSIDTALKDAGQLGIK